LKDLDQNETMLPHATRGRKKMTIQDACAKAVAEGYYSQRLHGIDTYYSRANRALSVWTRADNHSSLVVPMEGTFLDPLFWQA